MRAFRALALAFLLIGVTATAQTQRGLIRGTVVSPDGYPVDDAHVSAKVMQGSTVATVLSANTDENGQFAYEGLAWGEYRLSAEKTESGYLSTEPSIFNAGAVLTVDLREDAQTADTLIRFGRKAGVITGVVQDATTGASISAHLSLAPLKGIGWSTTGTDGKHLFRLLIPADTDVRFGACAEGYKPWFYTDPSNATRPFPVHLASGIELNVNIKLERSPEEPKKACAYTTF